MISREQLSGIGADLAVIGAIISCAGVVANNIWLDHVLAMHIWRFSNLILLVWAYGLYKKWWDGGISGAALVGMYGFYVVTNEYGLSGGTI